MARKLWVVREIAYQYNDNYYYLNSPGGIHDVYDDEADALIAMWEMEVERFRKMHLGDYEFFHGAGDDHHQTMRKRLDSYLKEALGETIFEEITGRDDLFVPKRIYLPKWLTDDQILEIRELTGIKFFDVYEFEDEAVFYGIWLRQDSDFLKEDMGKYGSSIYFFSSYDVALNEAKKRARWVIDFLHPRWRGEIGTLTNQPSVLKTLIEMSESLIYDEKKKMLQFFWRHPSFGDDLVALNSLLIEPIFEIRPISLEDAQQIPHLPFTLQ